MTIGANVLAILEVPRGWMRNRRTRMAQVTPMTVPLVMSGFTTESPCMAPRTDCAGVRTPSDMTRETPRTPMTFSAVLAIRLCSMPERSVRPDGLISEDKHLSILISAISLGSRSMMLA